MLPSTVWILINQAGNNFGLIVKFCVWGRGRCCILNCCKGPPPRNSWLKCLLFLSLCLGCNESNCLFMKMWYKWSFLHPSPWGSLLFFSPTSFNAPERLCSLISVLTPPVNTVGSCCEETDSSLFDYSASGLWGGTSNKCSLTIITIRVQKTFFFSC